VEVELEFKGSLFPLANQLKMNEPSLEDILQMLVHQHQPQGGYGVFSHGDGIISMALWYPILVAHDENGWDISPSEHIGDRSYFDIAHYDVTLTTSKEALIATTGVNVEHRLRGHYQQNRYVVGGVREFSI
jgi:hypothetical protein